MSVRRSWLILVSGVLWASCGGLEVTPLDAEAESVASVDDAQGALASADVPAGVRFAGVFSLRNGGLCLQKMPLSTLAIMESCEAKASELAVYVIDGFSQICLQNTVQKDYFDFGYDDVDYPVWLAQCLKVYNSKTNLLEFGPVPLAMADLVCPPGTPCGWDKPLPMRGVFAIPPAGYVTTKDGLALTNVGGYPKQEVGTKPYVAGAANQQWIFNKPDIHNKPVCENASLNDYLYCSPRFGADKCLGSLGDAYRSCSAGYSTIHRYITTGQHQESRVYPTTALYEGSFRFAAKAQSGGWPLYRCNGRISKASNCDGGLWGQLSHAGYSFPATGSKPVYQCIAKGGDYFLSSDSGCEGQKIDPFYSNGIVGYSR